MKKQAVLGLIAATVLTVNVMAQGFPDVYYYKFDAGSGTNIINWANPAVPPTWQNGVGGVWETTGAPVGAAAMNFSSLDYLRLGGGFDTSQSYTIELWVRTNVVDPGLIRLWADYSAGGSFRCYLSFYNSPPGNGADYTGGHLSAVTMNSGGGAVVGDAMWHHIALVHDAVVGDVVSYVDGNIDQGPFTVLPGGVGTDAQLGGNWQVGGAQAVAVDEFRVWQSARTQAEIIANMSVSLNPTQATPVFTASVTSGPAPLLVSFSDASVAPVGSSILSWAWDMESDGTVDYTTQNPCHAFATPNTSYDVTLTVDDGSGPVSATYTAFINTGNTDFVMGTCGAGDMFFGAPAPPANWPMSADGYTLISTTQNAPVGFGTFFGLKFDAATLLGLGSPAVIGNPLHFVNAGPIGVFPYTALTFPPGTFTPGSGVGFDACVVYRDSLGLVLIDPTTSLPAISGVARITF